MIGDRVAGRIDKGRGQIYALDQSITGRSAGMIGLGSGVKQDQWDFDRAVME